MANGVPDKVDDRFLSAARKISNEEFKSKYPNIFRLFNGDVNRAMTFADAIKHRESNGKPDVINQIGYSGLFQMREDTSFGETDYVVLGDNGGSTWSKKGAEQAKKMGITGVKEGEGVTRATFQKFFKDTPESFDLQTDAFFQYLNKVVTYPKSRETIQKLVGSNYQVEFEGKKYPATIEGALAAIHLLGHSGSHTALVRKAGGADGNGTTAEEYVATFSGQYKDKERQAYWDRDVIHKQFTIARGGTAQPSMEASAPTPAGNLANSGVQQQNPSVQQQNPSVQQPTGTTQAQAPSPYDLAMNQGVHPIIIFFAMLVEMVMQPSGTPKNTLVANAPVMLPPTQTPIMAAAPQQRR